MATAAAGEAQSQLALLLNDASYDIEFGGFLTNHVKHALVALAKLAKDENTPRVERYWSRYTTNTPYNIKLDPAHPVSEVSGYSLLRFSPLRLLDGEAVDFRSFLVIDQDVLWPRYESRVLTLCRKIRLRSR